MAIPSDLLDWVCEGNFCLHNSKDETAASNTHNIVHDTTIQKSANTTELRHHKGNEMEHCSDESYEVFLWT